MVQNILAKSSLFKNVDRAYIDDLVEECSEVELEPDKFLFHQGDLGKGMYIISEGSVDIVLEKGKKMKTVATFNEGAFFGEVCMLVPQDRIAGVRAKTKCRFLYLDIKQFQEHINNKDADALQVSHNIAITLIERLKKANEILSSIPDVAESSGGKKIREMSLYKEKLLSEVLF